MSEKILVIGSTGNVGTHLVQLLAEEGQAVKAATRQPQNYPVRMKVEAVKFEYEDSSSYAPALEGVDRVFLLAKTTDPEPQNTLNPFIDAAVKAGVRHVVLMTAKGAEQSEDAGLRKVEKHLIASGLAYTILRPSWFMQNFYPGFCIRVLRRRARSFWRQATGEADLLIPATFRMLPQRC